MTTYEILSTVIAGLALVVSTVVLILLVMQIRLLSRQVMDARQAIEHSTQQAAIEGRHRRQLATMDFIARTASERQQRYSSIPVAGSQEQASFLEKAMVRDSSKFAALRDYLNHLEDLSVGTNLEIFDKSAMYRSMGGQLCRAWHAYQPWITRERELVNVSLFADLEVFVREYEAGRSGSTAGAP